MSIPIADHPEGCVISVRARPRSRRNSIVGENADALKIAVTAPPEEGRANDSIVKVLADSLGLKRSQVELVSGATSRAKKFLVRGMTAETLQNKLRSLLDI